MKGGGVWGSCRIDSISIRKESMKEGRKQEGEKKPPGSVGDLTVICAKLSTKMKKTTTMIFLKTPHFQ